MTGLVVRDITIPTSTQPRKASLHCVCDSGTILQKYFMVRYYILLTEVVEYGE